MNYVCTLVQVCPMYVCRHVIGILLRVKGHLSSLFCTLPLHMIFLVQGQDTYLGRFDFDLPQNLKLIRYLLYYTWHNQISLLQTNYNDTVSLCLLKSTNDISARLKIPIPFYFLECCCGGGYFSLGRGLALACMVACGCN